MRRRKPRLSDFAVGAIVIVVVLIGTWLGFRKSIPFRHHYTVNAVFASANNIKPNSQVRIAGVNVGKVTGVKEVVPGRDGALVELRIDNRGLPLHTDATAKIRPRIFLEGNFFVELHPGSPSAPLLKDGGTIPRTQTAEPVQFDQLFTALQGDTRANLQKLLKGLASGLNDGGATAFNRSIPYWAPAYKNTAIVNDALLGSSRHDLSALVNGQGTVARALTRDRPALRALVTDLDVTARAFAVADDDLSAAISELPRTLRAGVPALRALNASFPAVRRFVAAARPAVRTSGPSLDAEIPLVRQLRGLVSRRELRGLIADLRPTVPALADFVSRQPSLLGQVRLASSCQNEVILPWTDDKIEDPDFPARRKVADEQTKFLPGIAGESRAGDANGQWFRILATLGGYAYPLAPQTFFLTDSPLRGVNPPKPTHRPLLRPDVPCETQQTPDLRTIPGAPPAGRKAVVPTSRQRSYRKMQDRAVSWLRRQIDRRGLEHVLKVTSKPLTRGQLGQLTRSVKR